MVVALIAALVVAAGMGYWLVSRTQTRPAGRPASASNGMPAKSAPAKEPAAKTGGRFAAVEIRTRGGACSSALALEGQRFLAKDAPALPLPKCSAAQCTCMFSKLADRRTDGRRLDFGGLSASQFLEKNRRTKRDRRAARARQKI
jgi:hypothetical protein